MQIFIHNVSTCALKLRWVQSDMFHFSFECRYTLYMYLNPEQNSKPRSLDHYNYMYKLADKGQFKYNKHNNQATLNQVSKWIYTV